jgi:hypothetical protein
MPSPPQSYPPSPSPASGLRHLSETNKHKYERKYRNTTHTTEREAPSANSPRFRTSSASTCWSTRWRSA